MRTASAQPAQNTLDALRRILVATDGSADAKVAVGFAVSLAHEFRGKLELCYALDYARAFAECSSVNGSVGLLEPLVHEHEESAKSILADASKRVAAATVEVTTVVLNGSPAEAIAERAKVGKADAIVVGTAGKRGLDRIVLGSVADGVLRRSDVPTFVLPAGAGSEVALRRFLVAVDDSEPSATVATFAIDLAKAVNAEIIFVGVAQTVRVSDEAVLYGYNPAPMLAERRAATALRLVSEDERACNKGVTSRSVVAEGVPADRILELAKAHDADLIIVGTHGRRGFRRLLLGSVAEAVVCRSRTPVVVVPARYVPATEDGIQGVARFVTGKVV